MTSTRIAVSRLQSILAQSNRRFLQRRGLATMSKYTLQDTVPLPPTSTPIPRLGLGVFMAKGSKCTTAVSTALKHGYRHIDSAQVRFNLHDG